MRIDTASDPARWVAYYRAEDTMRPEEVHRMSGLVLLARSES